MVATNKIIFDSSGESLEIGYDPKLDADLPYREISRNISSNLKAGTIYQISFSYKTEGNPKPFMILISTPYDPQNIALHEELPLSESNTFKKSVGWIAPLNDVIEPVIQLRNWKGDGVFRIRDLTIYELGKREVVFTNWGIASDYALYVRPGHFYSPIPSTREIKVNEDRLFSKRASSLPAVDLNLPQQLRLLEKFTLYYNMLSFPINKSDEFRYYYENISFGYGDAISLFSIMHEYKPKRIVEVGSGYSSCVTLDTNEKWFGWKIDCLFIEPFPDLFYSLIRKEDLKQIRILAKRLQDVSLEEFKKLEENDILFIDSTHVSKIGSDVNYIFFEILPCLHKGVLVHFHDIFYPFEYPMEWALEGRAWNEAYLCRAFLEYNSVFKIEFFNSYMAHFFSSIFNNKLPLFLRNAGGSLWLRKVRG